MNKLADTQELLNTGLTDSLPYLGSYSVVDALVRELLVNINAIRERQLMGVSVDVAAETKVLAEKFQDTMYGKNKAYIGSAWNTPDQLGRYLVKECEIGGSPDDAAMRVAAKLMIGYSQTLISFEEDKVTEEQLQFDIDSSVETYTHALLGLPYEGGA